MTGYRSGFKFLSLRDPARPSKRRTILERPYGQCRRPGFLSILRVLEIVHFAHCLAIGTGEKWERGWFRVELLDHRDWKNDTGRELEPNALIGVDFFWISSNIEKWWISQKFKLPAIPGYYLGRFRIIWSRSANFICFTFVMGVWISRFGAEISKFGWKLKEFGFELARFGVEISRFGVEV